MNEVEAHKKIYNPKKALDITFTILFVVSIFFLYSDIVSYSVEKSSMIAIVLPVLSLLFIVLSLLDLFGKLKKY